MQLFTSWTQKSFIVKHWKHINICLNTVWSFSWNDIKPCFELVKCRQSKLVHVCTWCLLQSFEHIPQCNTKCHVPVRTPTRSFQASFFPHNATRCNTMVQNWLNCQVNMSVMYWQQLIITLKKSGGVHTFKTTDLHNNSLSLGHDYKSILAIINHASIRENKNCKLAPAMYA